MWAVRQVTQRGVLRAPRLLRQRATTPSVRPPTPSLLPFAPRRCHSSNSQVVFGPEGLEQVFQSPIPFFLFSFDPADGKQKKIGTMMEKALVDFHRNKPSAVVRLLKLPFTEGDLLTQQMGIQREMTPMLLMIHSQRLVKREMNVTEATVSKILAELGAAPKTAEKAPDTLSDDVIPTLLTLKKDEVEGEKQKYQDMLEEAKRKRKEEMKDKATRQKKDDEMEFTPAECLVPKLLLYMGILEARRGDFKTALNYHSDIHKEHVVYLKRTKAFRQDVGWLDILAYSEATLEPSDILREKVDHDPTNLEHQLQYGVSLFVEGKHVASIERMLTVIRKNRKYKDDGAKKALLGMFTVLGGESEVVLKYQKRLLSILF
eukprot:Sspe_Gene.41008::Locus_19826_Transcript_1_1_Confidence_1.000_Length_1293::g.41008::m.41008